MKKRAQLVCQHLENISREALERDPEIIYQYVRGRQGVYALYRRGKLYYVGLATNLRNRLNHHLKDRHGHSWDRFSVYLTIGDHHLRELEALILRTVKPSGNKQKANSPGRKIYIAGSGATSNGEFWNKLTGCSARHVLSRSGRHWP